jgi:hypothetical protein
MLVRSLTVVWHRNIQQMSLQLHHLGLDTESKVSDFVRLPSGITPVQTLDTVLYLCLSNRGWCGSKLDEFGGLLALLLNHVGHKLLLKDQRRTQDIDLTCKSFLYLSPVAETQTSSGNSPFRDLTRGNSLYLRFMPYLRRK